MSNFEGPAEADAVARAKRLLTQHEAVRLVMLDGRRRTLDQISAEVQALGVRCPPASASAQLRHLRKPRFGGWIIDSEHVGSGLYEYWMQPPPNKEQQELF